MNPLINAAVFLINIISQFYIGLVLLRFLMQWVRADFYNPLAQFIVRATNPLLRPLRRMIPSVLGLDMASLLLALVLQILSLVLIVTAQGQFGVIAWGAIASLGGLQLILLMLHIYLIASFLLFVVSWLSPYNNSPLTLLTYQLVEPLVLQIRRYIPPFHGVDFSLMFIVIGVSLIKIVFIAPLMAALGAL
jgi:YggT family protein